MFWLSYISAKNLASKMKKIFKKYNLFIFIFLISLIPVFWAPYEAVIAGGDNIIYLNPGAFFKLSAWNPTAYIANFNGEIARIFPFGFFWKVCQLIGLHNPTIQRIWLFMMWFLAGIAITYLAKTFFPKRYKTISFFAVSFYLLNPFNVFLPLTAAIRHVHAFLPAILAFFAQGLKSQNSQKRNFYALSFGLATLLAAPAFQNPAAGSVICILPLLYFIFSLYTGRASQIIKKTIFGFKALVAFIFLNIYWLWTFGYSLISKNAERIIQSLKGKIFPTKAIFEIFRTLGGWGFAADPWKVDEYPFHENLWIVFASYFLILIAFISLFYIKKKRSILFFIFLSGVAIFLIKGDLPPWKEGFMYLFNNFSLFKGFREPWTKFSPLLLIALSMLFGFSCAKIIAFFKKRKSRVWLISFCAIIIAMLFSVGYPAIFGKNIWNYNLNRRKAQKTKIPDYWYQMADWFKHEDPDGVALVTPPQFSWPELHLGIRSD